MKTTGIHSFLRDHTIDVRKCSAAVVRRHRHLHVSSKYLYSYFWILGVKFGGLGFQLVVLEVSPI